MAEKRQSRYKPEPDRFLWVSIQERDLNIIESLVQGFRFLTTEQINSLFFGSPSACKLRLQKLWNKGFLKRVFAPVSFGSSKAIYSPTKEGISLLVESGRVNVEEIKWKGKRNILSHQMILHEIGISEFKVSLILAITREEKLYIERERGNPLPDLLRIEKLCRFEDGPSIWDYAFDRQSNKKIAIRPDTSFTLRGERFFVEVDRGTMSLKRVRWKMRGYKEYLLSGAFSERYGLNDFKLLTTAPSQERRNNLLEQAIGEGGLTRCLFGVFDEVVSDPLGDVWIRGKEYREMLNSLTERDRKRMLKAHRKRERDKRVRNQVKRYSFLSSDERRIEEEL
jgi:predicted transcriptional regulator